MDNQAKVYKKKSRGLRVQGYSEFTVAPPLYRMLWTHGIDIPIPLFMPFWSIVVFMGARFTVGFGVYAAVFILSMWLMGLENTPIARSLVATVFARLFFGVTMATYFRYQAKSFNLTVGTDIQRTIWSLHGKNRRGGRSSRVRTLS